MSSSTNTKPAAKQNRVQVADLPRQERDLKDQEAENVKGGGGSPGGVLRSHIGEDSPRTGRN
ncbi:MAG TPA: hypothetical protein VIK24_20130 [Pyrinomonadaceae bacterium]